MSSIENLVPHDASAVTPGATELSKVVGLHANEAGTATILTRGGSTVNIALAAGADFVMGIRRVTAWTGTAGSLIAIRER